MTFIFQSLADEHFSSTVFVFFIKLLLVFKWKWAPGAQHRCLSSLWSPLPILQKKVKISPVAEMIRQSKLGHLKYLWGQHWHQHSFWGEHFLRKMMWKSSLVAVGGGSGHHCLPKPGVPYQPQAWLWNKHWSRDCPCSSLSEFPIETGS